MPLVVITERWCLTQDRSRVVPEGDPEARWLHWLPGDEVDEREARRLGALKSRTPEANKARRPGNHK